MSALGTLAAGTAGGIWKLLACALAGMLLLVASGGGTGWWLAAHERDQLQAALQQEQGISAQLKERIKTMEATAARIQQAQIQVVEKTEIQYRDRIKTVYIQGETIERSVPLYITDNDNARYGVNSGFVRLYNAAWSNVPAEPATSADRAPTAIPLADIAAVDTFNATSCHAWREQAIGLKAFYMALQAAAKEQEMH